MFAITKRRLLLAASLGGLIYASQFYTLSGLQHVRIESRGNSTAESSTYSPNSSLASPLLGEVEESNLASTSLGSSLQSLNPAKLISLGKPTTKKRSVPTIRIATFNMESFGESKLAKPGVVEIIASMIRQFDVVALQDINARQQDIVPRLIEKLNQGGRHFDFCIGPRVGDGVDQQQFAFVFDTQTIETDRFQLYTLSDPQGLMTYDPLVGWFRTTCVEPREAFTFSLVNVRIDSAKGDRERALLPGLIQGVAKDGRSEDDVIIAGDFGASDQAMSLLRSRSPIRVGRNRDECYRRSNDGQSVDVVQGYR